MGKTAKLIFSNLNSVPDSRVIKYRIRWVGHVACIVKEKFTKGVDCKTLKGEIIQRPIYTG